ncbi:hypothetical protein HanIR_Chr10g0463591 [Helianthus annuus]|nr:hypothetical protein HanIR_Chr10g0463591 [Helianthus annuus]
MVVRRPLLHYSYVVSITCTDSTGSFLASLLLLVQSYIHVLGSYTPSFLL